MTPPQVSYAQHMAETYNPKSYSPASPATVIRSLSIKKRAARFKSTVAKSPIRKASISITPVEEVEITEKGLAKKQIIHYARGGSKKVIDTTMSLPQREERRLQETRKLNQLQETEYLKLHRG